MVCDAYMSRGIEERSRIHHLKSTSECWVFVLDFVRYYREPRDL